MAKVGELTVEIEGDDRSLDRAADRSVRQLDRISDKAKRMGKRLRGAFTAAAAAAGAMAGASVVAFKSMTDEMDKLIKASRQIGVPIEQLSKMRFAADLSGVSVKDLTKSYRNFARNATAASRGPTDFTRALEALNIEFKNTDGSLRSANDVMLDVADEFSKLEDGSSKTAFAMKIFGEEAGPRLVSLLNQGSAGIKEMTAEADRLGLTITTKAGVAAESFNDTINRLQTTFSGIVQSAIGEILPVFDKIAKEFLTWVQTSGAAKVAMDTLAFSLKSVASVAVILGNVFQTVGKVVRGVVSTILELVEGDVSGAFDVMSESARGVVASNTLMAERLREIWQGLPDAAVEAGTGIQAGMQSAIKAADDTTSAADRAAAAWKRFQAAFDEGADKSQEGGNKIAKALQTPEKQMNTLVGAIGDGLGTIFEDSKAVAIAQALINTYEGISKALSAYPPPLSTAMAAIQAAVGFAQVAKIKSTSRNSSSGGGSSAGSTGAGAAAGAAASAGTGGGGGPAQSLVVSGIDPNSLFSGDSVRGLAERLIGFQRDGGNVILAEQ